MEEPIVVPEDLNGLPDEELESLGLQIRERVSELADEARNNDDVLAEVEGLMASYDEITEIGLKRSEARAERSARVDAALGRFEDLEVEEAEVEEAEVEEAAEEVVAEAEVEEAEEAAAEEEAVAEAAEEVAVEAATEEAVEEAATEEPAEAATEVEETVEAAAEVEVPEAEEVVEEAAAEETIEAAAEEAEVIEETAEVEAEFAAEAETKTEELATEAVEEAATDTNEEPGGNKVANDSDRSAVSRLADRRPEELAPRPGYTGGASLTARGIGGGVDEGQTIDIPTLAKAIVDKRIAMGNVPSGTFEMVTVASALADFGEDTLGTGYVENFSVLARISEQFSTERTEETALVASGGVCAPIAPSYDFFRLAEEMNPVERALPVANAPRGGIRYISPPDFRDAAPGVRVTTEAEDAAGYESQGGPTPDKPCVAVTCPDIQECRVDAVSRCVTFGNLNYRVFPEQVAAFLADLSVIFTETKEIFYLDAIDAASTPVTSIQSYSAVRTLIYDLLVASANYRRRHHMSPTATLEVFLPSWLPELLKVDMVNDHALGLSFVDADMAAINRFFAQANLSVTWYYDSATGAGQAFNTAQGVGDLNSFPGTVVSYLFSPGTFVRLDAGTLDVGLVRDSALNATNDLQLFAEQWIQVCMVGLESLRIEHTLCPDGTAPEPVTPLVCPTGSS